MDTRYTVIEHFVMTLPCCVIWAMGDQKTMIIGEQKVEAQNKIKRNFGMPNPEGYRKALRAVRLAEKFDIPVLCLVDTPGAYPGLGAEERVKAKQSLEIYKGVIASKYL